MPKKNKLFSILIANYNNGKFFSDCYKSIINQTYQNWEVIIVDDCSEDNSIEIIENITRGDHRFKVYKNDRNRGCGFTKNLCLVHAIGIYCGFLDPDDTLKTHAVETMMDIFSKNPNASIVSSRFDFVDFNLNFLRHSPLGGEIPNKESFLTSSNGEVSHFAAFSRQRIIESGGVDNRLKRAVDQDLYFKLEEKGTHIFVNEVLYNYRQHSGGISQNENFEKSLYWSIRAKKSAYRRRIKSNSDLKNLTRHELRLMECKYLKNKLYDSRKKRPFFDNTYLYLRILHLEPELDLLAKTQKLFSAVAHQIIKRLNFKFFFFQRNERLRFPNKNQKSRLIQKVKIKSSVETISIITDTISRKLPGAFMRFGDGDLYLSQGMPDILHKPNSAMAKEMRQALRLKGKNIHKGLPLHSDIFGFEEGMFEGVHKVSNNDAIRYAFGASKYFKTREIYSCVALHHVSLHNKEVFLEFMKLLNQSTTVFVGNKNISEDLIRSLFNCPIIPTPASNSYSQINRIESELCALLNNRRNAFSLAVIAMGCPGRILQKRIIKKGYNAYLFDFGSLLDAFNGEETRDWIKLTGGVVYYQDLLKEVRQYTAK